MHVAFQRQTLIRTVSVFIVDIKQEFTAAIDAPLPEIMKVQTADKLNDDAA